MFSYVPNPSSPPKLTRNDPNSLEMTMWHVWGGPWPFSMSSGVSLSLGRELWLSYWNIFVVLIVQGSMQRRALVKVIMACIPYRIKYFEYQSYQWIIFWFTGCWFLKCQSPDLYFVPWVAITSIFFKLYFDWIKVTMGNNQSHNRSDSTKSTLQLLHALPSVMEFTLSTTVCCIASLPKRSVAIPFKWIANKLNSTSHKKIAVKYLNNHMFSVNPHSKIRGVPVSTFSINTTLDTYRLG